MKPLTRKAKRTIDRALVQLFSKQGLFVPKWPDDFKRGDVLSREVKLADNKLLFLTDLGVERFREVVGILHDEDLFGGQVAYSDAWSACREALQELLSLDQRPDLETEFVTRVFDTLQKLIGDHTFVVPLLGVEFKDVDELAIGSFRVVRPSLDYLNAKGIVSTQEHAPRFVEDSKHVLWLTGTVRATAKVAVVKFRERAQLITGLISIVAGSMYENGAHGFRIGIAMSPEEAHGRAKYISWREDNKSLVTTYQFSRGQRLTIDPERRADLEASILGQRATSIIESTTRSELEEAIARAIHWYSDAHRDEVFVMRFLKYWSCVEAFFSSSKKKITAAVSIGLAATLTHGHFKAAPPEQYSKLRKQVVRLYGLRSQAAHRAAYDHITEKEVADLSQWVSWLILNALVFVDRGANTTSQLSKWTNAVHRRNSRAWGWLRSLGDRVRRVFGVLKN